jgi:hypothetical protein
MGRNTVRQIKPPIIYILGGSSPIVPPETQMQLKLLLPEAEIGMMPGLGHDPSDEQAQAFLTIVERFHAAGLTRHEVVASQRLWRLSRCTLSRAGTSFVSRLTYEYTERHRDTEILAPARACKGFTRGVSQSFSRGVSADVHGGGRSNAARHRDADHFRTSRRTS